MRKHQIRKKRLQVTRESVRELSQPQLANAVGGSTSCGSCFPDWCMERETSDC